MVAVLFMGADDARSPLTPISHPLPPVRAGVRAVRGAASTWRVMPSHLPHLPPLSRPAPPAPRHTWRPPRRPPRIAFAGGVGALGVTSSPAAAAPSPLSCGAVVTTDVRLTTDLVDCPGSGLIIGAARHHHRSGRPHDRRHRIGRRHRQRSRPRRRPHHVAARSASSSSASSSSKPTARGSNGSPRSPTSTGPRSPAPPTSSSTA